MYQFNLLVATEGSKEEKSISEKISEKGLKNGSKR